MESSDGQGIATAGHSFDDGASRLACEGFAIVRAKCARCHADPPEHGAPFSLTMPEDLELLDRQGVTRRWRMAEAIERGRMPARYVELEPPVEELSDEERELLLTWLRADGPDAATNCD